MISTDGIKCPAADAAVVWCNHCQPRERGVYQRRRLQRTSAPSHFLASPTSTFRCAHRSVRHHERPLPWKASRLRDSSAGFCLEEAMGLRSGGSGVCGVRGRLLAAGSRRYGQPSPATFLSGQYGIRRAPYGVPRGRETARLMASDSPLNMSPHYRRNLGNPHTEKALQGRSRQSFR